MSHIALGGIYRNLRHLIVGRPIPTKRAHEQRLPKVFALPVFASDALSSAAYATEETMRILMLAGASFFTFTFPIAIAVSVLLFIVGTSYNQTIKAYPTGGGAYSVASANLGSVAGRIAGASLLIDYVLTVSVSISAGILALVSMSPALHPFVIELGVGAILIIAMVNLRGTKESGAVFAIPSYSFVALMLAMIGWGLFRLSSIGPVPPPNPEAIKPAAEAFGLILLLRAFSSGCVALTGTEAISNGVQAFRAPEPRNAAITLSWMAALLMAMFLGSAYLAQNLQIQPMDLDAPGFKTVIALISEKLFGIGPFFYLLQIATALILILAANTAFADFPRLASLMARDGFLPRQLMVLGDRLVFQNGILVLSGFSIFLVIAFKGDTHALIPLYAVGVFTSFTLSQIGMVLHQVREGKGKVAIISLVGGITTGIVTLVLLITKFEEGAWMVLVAVAVMLFLFSRIRAHYDYLARELTVAKGEHPEPVETSAILLVPRMHRGILKAISYAESQTKDVRALHVTLDKSGADHIKKDWLETGLDMPLVILESPFRSLIDPLTNYIDEMISQNPEHLITVIVPQAIPKYWWHGILHNNAAYGLKRALRSRRNVVITNIRYFLN